MRIIRLSAGLMAMLMLAGCAGNPIVTGSIPSHTIAFESIDGPPSSVSDRLVATLAAEAAARQLPIVSRTDSASYRVRAYLATHVETNTATLSWVWDVFDAKLNYAFRLSGEEPLGFAHKDVWGQCDDTILARVATRSFDALTARLGAASPSSPVPGSETISGSPQVAAAGNPQTVASAAPRP